MSLSQIELVWVRVRVEWECFWVNLKEDTKVSESKRAVSESNMTEFKMAAIIKLSQNEWANYFFANGGNQSWQVWVSLRGNTKMAEFKMADHHFEWEWKIEVFFLAKWMIPTWQNLIWLPSSSWIRMNEWGVFCGNGGNQSWQVWVSLRGNNKMAVSKMAKIKMAEFKMDAIIKFNENEWVWVRLN